MRILALEPYYGGSHRAFLDGWSARSRHDWTVLHLPPHKWKWRMRHGAITLADEVAQRSSNSQRWDVLFCSDMLNLAEFLGLAPLEVRQMPAVVYFHENQLTYPVRHETERDHHYVMTNMTSALAAASVWFNSAFHRDSFLDELPRFLKRMPDHQPFDTVERIRAKSSIHHPGVRDFPSRGSRSPGPLRILWAARWEHDKNPETFFEAMQRLKAGHVVFRLSVVGEQFRDSPLVFQTARETFCDHIDRWGYQPSREEYEAALTEADVIVSTADHEFFGISVVEAIAAGAYPMLPQRLAYPEILDAVPDAEHFFYTGGASELADRLAALTQRLDHEGLWQGDPDVGVRAVTRFAWSRRVPDLDDALCAIRARR